MRFQALLFNIQRRLAKKFQASECEEELKGKMILCLGSLSVPHQLFDEGNKRDWKMNSLLRRISTDKLLRNFQYEYKDTKKIGEKTQILIINHHNQGLVLRGAY